MIEVDRDTIEGFASFFRGRTDSHGRVEVCVYEPVTLEHYETHLKGEANLGIYFVLDDSTCYFAAIDLDEKDFNKAKAIRDELVQKFIPAYIAASKSKGYHIYCFALEKFKAVEIRRVLKHVLDKLNIKAEVFPKQDYHQSDDPDGKKHPGSYINLPSFGYTRPFLAGDMKKVPLEVALDRIKFVPQESIARVLQTLTKEKPLELKKVVGRRKEHPPCLESISQGVDEKQRDAAALALARHYLIQAYEPGEVLWLLQEWDSKNKPPSYSEPFLENTVRSAEKYRGFFCSLIEDKPTVSTFCVGDEKCDWPKPKKLEEELLSQERPERSKEFNELAIEQLLKTCPFIQHCRDDAPTLSEPDWFSECDILSFFGEPGREKAHELSQPYPKYTREETDQKLEYAKEAKNKAIGPHTCAHIEKNLGFPCPGDCLAKKWGLKSPVVLANRLARTAGLPLIFVTDRFLKEKTADTIAAVEQANMPPQIFERSGHLVRIGHDELGVPYIEAVTESACRGFIERAAAYVRVNNEGKMIPLPAPPLDIVRDFMSLPHRNLPALLGITEVPILRGDGSILTEPGYDKATRLYYQPAPGLTIPMVSDSPTLVELQGAVALIQEPILDFPFDSEASRTNALALMITPVCRPMIPGPVPLCLLDKPQAGTGAGLLSDVIAIIATGRQAAMMAPPKNDEECEKRLTSILRHGRAIITIDNMDGYLYFPSLSMILTAATVQTRILGQSEELLLPNRATYIVTGNNVRLAGDLPRRCYLSRMDARVARPWMRDPKNFKYEHLMAWVKEGRGELLAAILIMARAWIAAGKLIPDGLPTLGGFEDWTNIVGGILAHAGFGGFLENLAFMYSQSDVETAQWEAFLGTWHDIIGEEPVTSAELITYIKENPDLRSTLPDIIGDTEAKNYSVKVGQNLGRRNGVQYPSGLELKKAGASHRAITWKVAKFTDSTSPLFSYKSEVGEVINTQAHKAFENNDKKEDEGDRDTYKSGVIPTSPTSSLATKQGEVDPWFGMPDYPKAPCPTCSGTDFWPDFVNKRFICGRCHPQPPGIDMEV
ncbi:hypothetical protein ES708_05400 [subsurface metagenome]